jgi:hypothetical protein
MKWLLALVLLTSLARAQSEALAPLRVDEVSLDRAYRRARAKRNIGIGLAVPGVASTLLGILVICYGAQQDPNLFSKGVEIVSGALTAGIGIAVGIPGVVLWSNGQDEMDVVKWRRAQLKLTLNGAVITF